MLEPLIILLIFIGLTVVIAGLVVAVMIRTRRPHEGVRRWVQESADYWQNDEHREQAKQARKGRVKQTRLSQVLEEAAQSPADPMSEVDELRSAAARLWDEEIVEKRRQAKLNRGRKLDREIEEAARSAAPVGSPTYPPGGARRKVTFPKVQETNTGERTTAPPFPVGAQPVLPANLPPSFAPRDTNRRRPGLPGTNTTKLPVFPKVREDESEAGAERQGDAVNEKGRVREDEFEAGAERQNGGRSNSSAAENTGRPSFEEVISGASDDEPASFPEVVKTEDKTDLGEHDTPDSSAGADVQREADKHLDYAPHWQPISEN